MTRYIIWGIAGRLGHTVMDCIAKTDNAELVCGIDKFADQKNFSIPVYPDTKGLKVNADVVIDFSRPDAIFDILPFCEDHNLGAVLCTTGYTTKHQEYIEGYAAKLPLFQASNMSLGVNLLIDLARKASRTLGQKFDIEIIEKHHNIKVDSPSGTAITIAKAINEEFDNTKEFVYGRHGANERRKPQEIGIHAIRGGTIVGQHDVMFIGNDEVITISHEASSKAVFAEGAIKAGKFIKGRTPKIYNMQDLLND